MTGSLSSPGSATDSNANESPVSGKIVGANPDLIFLANSMSESMTAEDVAARPGWSEITAVKEGRIEALDEDLASRWGPRLPEFFRSIAAVLSDAGVPAAAAN